MWGMVQKTPLQPSSRRGMMRGILIKPPRPECFPSATHTRPCPYPADVMFGKLHMGVALSGNQGRGEGAGRGD